MNQRVRYLGQMLFSSQVVFRPRRQTQRNTHTDTPG